MNHSTVFFKTQDVILTNDIWRIVLDLDLKPYEEIIATLKEDLFLVQNQTLEFTFVNELRQVDILLTTLEAKLNYLKQFLPKLDPRRGLVNLGGVILKTLFGAIVGDTHNIRLILNVPLKTANRNFVLYKLIAFPMPVLNNTFVQYKPNYLYFGFNEIQHSHALFTEAEINRCVGGSVAMCPADKAIYTTKVVTCESSLFFQTLDSHKLCQRQIFQHHKEPVWTRHDWIYNIPEPQQVTFRCLENRTWTSHSRELGERFRFQRHAVLRRDRHLSCDSGADRRQRDGTSKPNFLHTG